MNKENFKRKKTIITGFIALLVVVIIGGGFYYITVITEAREEAKIQYNSLQSQGTFYKKILESTSEDGYLLEKTTEQQVQQFSTQLENQKDSLTKFNKKYPKNKLDLSSIDDLHNMIMNLDYKLATEKELNTLITYSNYLSDTNPQIDKIVITDNLTNDNLKSFTDLFQSKEIIKDKWTEKVQSIIDEMTKQLKQIDVAKNKTNALFEGDKVKEGSSSKDYDAALIEVEKITRKKDKEELLKKLNLMKDYLEQQKEMNEPEEVDTELVEEQYLLNSLDEARSYLSNLMPQAGGPQQFVNGLVTNEGYYSFDYQLHGGPEGVVWNRIIIDRNQNTISNEYLKTVANENMEENFDYYQENTGSTLTESEAIRKAADYHHGLGRPNATLLYYAGVPGGFTIEYMEGEAFIYSYFVSDDGSVIEHGIVELFPDEEYEESFE